MRPLRPLLLALAPLAFALGCDETIRPDPAGPSSSAGALATTKAEDGKVTDEGPPDTSPLVTKIDGEAKRLNVVAYRSAADQPIFGAKASTAFRVHPFRDRMLVTLAGQMYTVDGDKLQLDPKAVTTEAVPGNTPVLGAYEVTSLEGSYPDTLFVEAEFQTFLGARQDNSRTVRYARADGAWKVQEHIPTSVRTWKAGTLLGVVNGKVAVVGGAATAPTPRMGDGSEGCPASAPMLNVRDIDTLPSGEIYATGLRCGDETFVLERYPADGGPSTVEAFPSPPAGERFKKITRIRAGGPRSVFAVAEVAPDIRVARFDGRALRPVEMHDRGRVTDAWATADGALFLLIRAEDPGLLSVLVRIQKDGTYTRFVPPQKVYALTLWASDANTAYVAQDSFMARASVLYGTGTTVLLGTPPKEVTEPEPTPPPAASASAAPAPAPEMAFPEFTDACTTPLVFLYDVSASAPPKFDFPTTRKALSSFPSLKEIKLFDFVFAGKRRLGAHVPNAEVGKALVAHIQATMKDEAPKLVCFDPVQELREIDL